MMEKTDKLNSEALRIWQSGLEKGAREMLDRHGQYSFALSQSELEEILFPIWEKTALSILLLFGYNLFDSNWSAMSKEQKRASAKGSLSYDHFHNQIMGSFKTYGRHN